MAKKKKRQQRAGQISSNEQRNEEEATPNDVESQLSSSGMNAGSNKNTNEVSGALGSSATENPPSSSSEKQEGGTKKSDRRKEKAAEGVVTDDQSATAVDLESSSEMATEPSPKQRAEFWINGMTCTVCSQIIERAVRNDLKEVTDVAISLATDTASVSWMPGDKDVNATVEEIKEAIETVGYSVERVVIESDDDRSNNNTSTSEGPSGNENRNEMDQIEQRWQQLQERQANKVNGRRFTFMGSLIGTVPILMLTMIIPRTFIPILHRPVVLNGLHTDYEALLLWLLATPVQFLAGWEFYRGAFFAVCLAGRAGMDVLIALGTSASYGYAVFGVVSGDTLSAHFFETSAVLISFVLGGKWMQALAVRRTSEALSQLLELQAKTAIKITPMTKGTTFDPSRDAFREERVPIEQIHTGDIVKVLQGASVPADGTVLCGDMSVDESMVTGESMPVLKTVGSSVLGGTVCVETGGSTRNTGATFCEVTATGSETALASIVQLVHDAQTRVVPIQTFADTVSAYFVPAVCAVSLITFLVWYALCSTHVVPATWYGDDDPMTFSILFAIACLVISCPCALGLATPTAVMVGTGVSAKLGILLKGGESLEVSSKVDSVIFDKTGTLTEGKPSVSDFLRLDDKGQQGESQLLWLLGSLERSSEHPLAKAIVRYAEEKLGEDNMEEGPFEQPTEFRYMTGRGALGKIGEITIAVGNRAFAESNGYEVSFVAEECMESLEEEGKTAVLVIMNGIVSGILGIVDTIKEDAGPAIDHLRSQLGVDVWMVTGDNSTTATAVGKKLDLPRNRIIAEALPATKLEQVRKLQAEGKVVAMVGDGINDSPALAQADVGLSLGTGAAIANEASDIVLVKGRVLDVCIAFDLSRIIFKRIQWNFVWSLIYNCLGIPVAAGVFYPLFKVRLPPTVAALAMALSSVSVVLSSMTLRWYKPPHIEVLTERQRARQERRQRRQRQQENRRTRSQRRESTGDFDSNMTDPLLDNQSEVTDATEQVDNRTARRTST